MKVIQVTDELWDELKKWAAAEGTGGWQNLCAKLVRMRVSDNYLHELRMTGIDMCIENLQALKAAEEDGS